MSEYIASLGLTIYVVHVEPHPTETQVRTTVLVWVWFWFTVGRWNGKETSSVVSDPFHYAEQPYLPWTVGGAHKLLEFRV